MNANSKLEELFKDKSNEYIDQSVNQAILIMLVISLFVVFGIYLFIEHLVSHFWADVWLVAACIYEVKSKYDLVSEQLKDQYRHERQDKESTTKEDTNYAEAEVIDNN